jgi:hypothetical protein
MEPSSEHKPSSTGVAQTTNPSSAKTPSRFVDRASKLHVPKEGSGRTRHEEKITFYCTREELLAIERARVALREYGINADRGRIVREALSYTLADLDANGQGAILAQRLRRR